MHVIIFFFGIALILLGAALLWGYATVYHYASTIIPATQTTNSIFQSTTQMVDPVAAVLVLIGVIFAALGIALP
jgi:cell division protein FtsX